MLTLITNFIRVIIRYFPAVHLDYCRAVLPPTAAISRITAILTIVINYLDASVPVKFIWFKTFIIMIFPARTTI